MNRFEEAREALTRARDLDPYSRVLNMAIGVNLFYLRTYDKAIEQLDKVIEANPDFPGVHFWKSVVLVQVGKFEEAIEEAKQAVELDNGSAAMKSNLAQVYARAGDGEFAVRTMDEAISDDKGYVSPSTLAEFKFTLGQKDEAFSLMRKACEIHDTTLLYLRGSPGFEECESDPRWAEIERKIGLPKR